MDESRAELEHAIILESIQRKAIFERAQSVKLLVLAVDISQAGKRSFVIWVTPLRRSSTAGHTKTEAGVAV